MLKKFFILLGFIITVVLVSQTFDGDFGWHLRFGQDAFAGNFQYLDNYTYPYFGEAWTNHEWGGDMVFWFLYSNLGYFSLVLFVSGMLWASFLVIQKHYFKNLTPLTISLAILFLLSLKFLIVMRLAMVSALFFALIIVGLENNRFGRSYYSWPLIFWLWSAMHGSWILGFIVINIYAIAAVIALLLRNRFGRETDWDKETFRKTYLYQMISAAVICINPYGIKIWSEVGDYFSEGFFKQVINEWLPSYAYPVYVWPLIIGGLALALIIFGLKNKKITLSQAAVFGALLFSAWSYKRNNIYLVLVSLPIITYAVIAIKQSLSGLFKKTPKVLPNIFWWVVGLCTMICFVPQIHFSFDIWDDQVLFAKYGFPYDAVKFLQAETRGRTISVFNEFWWGGYLNWMMPHALVYLDGRGTATWYYSEEKTALQSYREIKYEAGGLKKIEQQKTEYILLEKLNSGYSAPDKINKMIFTPEQLNKLFVQEPVPLFEELRTSNKWYLVYEDHISEVWKNGDK